MKRRPSSPRRLLAEKKAIFKRSSMTYFNAALFFPKAVRGEVITLYAFVRRADDYVDAVPQDPDGFACFRRAYASAIAGANSGRAVVDHFAALSRRRGFDPEWTEAFLEAMAADLTKSRYETIDETLAYVYGSAEVIGCFMARILGLPAEAQRAARMQGRAMQYINFVRDIDEDSGLGRRYLPIAESRLPKLSEEYARAQPDEFRRYVREQLARYLVWQRRADAGYHYIPSRYRIAIKTAADMYRWTAAKIAADPFVVFRRKVKPRRVRVLLRAAANTLRELGGRSWSFFRPGNRASQRI